MLILLTLSLLKSSDHNNTSDIASHVYNMALNASGAQPKKTFNILLNDTGSTVTKDVLKNEKRVGNKRNKYHIPQILKKHFSTHLNITESKNPEKIPQSDDIYYNTPPQAITHRLEQHLRLSNKHKKHPSKLGISPEVLETTPASEEILLSSKLDTRPHKNHKMHKRRMSTKIYNTTKEKLTQALTTPQRDNVYYNTPPVIHGVDNGPIIKKHYGRKKKVSRHILHRYKNVQNNTHKGHMHRSRIPKEELVKSLNITDTTSESVDIPQSHVDIFHNQAQRKEGHRKSRTISKKHLRISPSFIKTTISIVDVLQTNNSIFNISNKNRVSHNSELRKQFDEPIMEDSTYAPISILLGDETLPDMPRLGQDAFGELEDTKMFSVPSNFMTSSSLAPGDVLYGLVLTEQSTQKPFMEAYYKKMETNNIGYLSMAFEGLCKHLASMKPKHVTEIIKYTDVVVRELQAKGRLQWLEQPMTMILRDLAIVLSGEAADELQLRAMILKSLMRDRRKIVGTDVNKILDFADNLITKKDGNHLLTVIQGVKQFPNVNKTGKELCTDIIEAFETPFLYLSGTTALQRVVESANKAFAGRFQQYSQARKGKDRPGEGTRLTTLKPSSKQKMQKSVVRPSKAPTHSSVMNAQKSKQALNQPSKDKRTSKDKNSSKDKHRSEASSKDKPHSKHKHTSNDRDLPKHKRIPKSEGLSKDKHPSKDMDSSEAKHPSKNTRTSKSKKPSRSKHPHKTKHYPKNATITPRHKYLKPNFLLGVK